MMKPAQSLIAKKYAASKASAIKPTLSCIVALVYLSACSSDGVDSSDGPETLIFSSPSTTSQQPATTTLDDPTENLQSEMTPANTDTVDTTEEVNASAENTTDLANSDASRTELIEYEGGRTVSNDDVVTGNSTDPSLTVISEHITPFSDMLDELILPQGGELPSESIANVLGEDTPANSLLDALASTANLALANLNQKLSSGEELNVNEENCLYDYDMAEGNPLMGLQCLTTGISIDRLGVLNLREAAFAVTDPCSNALASMESDGCELLAASVTIKSHNNSLVKPSSQTDSQPDQQLRPVPPEPELTRPDIVIPELTRPDIELPEPSRPDIELTEHTMLDVDLSEITRPAVDVPEITRPGIDLTEITRPEVELPDLAQPNGVINEHNTSDVDLSEITRPEIDLPNITRPDIELPELSRPDVDLTEHTTLDVELSEISRPEIDLPNIARPEIELPELAQPVVNLSDTTEISSIENQNNHSGSIDNTITNRPLPNMGSDGIDKPSILDEMLNQIPESIVNIERPDGSTVVLESSNPSNTAVSEEITASDENRQFHSGATIRYGVDRSQLFIESVANPSATPTICALDVATGELIRGEAANCDAEFTRLTERLNYILTVITEDQGSL